MRVIGYVRVSTEQQDTERQIKQIKNYCELNQHELVEILEDKVSGTTNNRKGLYTLLSRDKENGDLVVISEQSRFSREKDIVHVLSSISNVLNNGLDLVFLDNPNKVYKAGEVLEIQDIIILVAQAHASNLEREKIIYRMRSGKESKYSNNPYAFVYSNVPFGFNKILNPNYKANSSNNESKYLIEINKEQANIIRTMFDLYANHNYTFKDLHLYVKGLGYDLAISTITKLFKYRIYIGERYMNGKLIHGIEPIVSIDLFEKVTNKVYENRICKEHTTTINPLKGIIKCSCGEPMAMRNRASINLSQYVCLGRKLKSNDCTCYGMDISMLLDIVTKSIISLGSIKEYNEETTNQIKQYEFRINELESIVNDLEAQQRGITNQYENIIDSIAKASTKQIKELYEQRLVDLTNKESSLKNTIKANKLSIAKYKASIESLSSDTSNIKDIPFSELKQLALNLIEVVRYHSIDIHKVFIEIVYKNGITMLYMIRKGYKRDNIILLLPNSFNYDCEVNKVRVEVMKPTKDITFNMQDMFVVKHYSFDQILNNFPFEDWKV